MSDATQTLKEAAAAWRLRLADPACDAATRRRFEVWLAAHPSHREEYARFDALWNLLGRLDHPDQRRDRQRSVRAAAAGVLLAAISGLLWFAVPVETRYVAAVGETRELVLADGSRVDLAPGSELVARLGGFGRTLELQRGEAHFTVVHERLRGFEVKAGGGVVRDIGTAFNIALDAGTARVGVTDGVVEVTAGSNAPLRLEKGQTVAWQGETLGAVALEHPADFDAWRRGRWVFDATPLATVVARLNRQHLRPVKLADPALAGLEISGEFNSADRDGLIRALTLLLPVQARETSDATVLDLAG